MAKHSLLMGTARGKLGNMVLSRVNGVQIARAYNPEVANPKTVGQATQRAIFATVAHMAAFLSAIITNSFDSFKNGQRDRNAFSAENVKLLRDMYLNQGQAAVCLNSKSSNRPAPNTYLISKGSLGRVNPTLVGDGIAFGFAGSQAGATISFGELRELWPALAPGAQLTFVGIIGSANDLDGRVVRYARIVFNELVSDNDIVFDCTNQVIKGTTLDLDKCDGFPIDTDGNLMLNSDARSVITTGVDDGEGYVKFGYEVDETLSGYAIAGGIILSKYNSTKGTWEHSTSNMMLCDNGFLWEPTDDVAIPSYMAAPNRNVGNNWYTEQSDSSNRSITKDYNTVGEAVQGIVRCLGYDDKSLKFDQSNTFGPVAEGKYVYFDLIPAEGVTIKQGSVKCLVGAVEDTEHVTYYRNDNGNCRIRFEVPQGEAQSYQLNVTFKVDYGQGEVTGAFRDTVSVVQG